MVSTAIDARHLHHIDVLNEAILILRAGNLSDEDLDTIVFARNAIAYGALTQYRQYLVENADSESAGE